MANDAPGNGLRGRDLIGLGGLLVGGVVGGLALGLLADDLFDSAPVGALIGVFAGIVLACAGFVLRVRSALRG